MQGLRFQVQGSRFQVYGLVVFLADLLGLGFLSVGFQVEGLGVKALWSRIRPPSRMMF